MAAPYVSDRKEYLAKRCVGNLIQADNLRALTENQIHPKGRLETVPRRVLRLSYNFRVWREGGRQRVLTVLYQEPSVRLERFQRFFKLKCIPKLSYVRSI